MQKYLPARHAPSDEEATRRTLLVLDDGDLCAELLAEAFKAQVLPNLQLRGMRCSVWMRHVGRVRVRRLTLTGTQSQRATANANGSPGEYPDRGGMVSRPPETPAHRRREAAQAPA